MIQDIWKFQTSFFEKMTNKSIIDRNLTFAWSFWSQMTSKRSSDINFWIQHCKWIIFMCIYWYLYDTWPFFRFSTKIWLLRDFFDLKWPRKGQVIYIFEISTKNEVFWWVKHASLLTIILFFDFYRISTSKKSKMTHNSWLIGRNDSCDTSLEFS